MGAASDFWENKLVDGLFRRGVKAWTAAESGITVGMMRYGSTANAYGKVMLCTAAGNGICGGTEPTWPAVNDAAPNTVQDSGGGPTWTVYAIGMYSPPLWLALFSVSPSDSSGGTETTGTSYARVAVHPSGTTWRSTNGTTTFPSSGTSGQTDNANSVSFPQAGSSWGTISAVGLMDASSGGNLLYWNDIADQSVASGNTVTFNANAMTIQVDN